MKLNKEIIGAIAGEYTKIGNAHVAIGEYLKQLAQADDVPTIEEVLEPVVKTAKAPVKEVEVVEEEEVEETPAEEVTEEEEEAEELTLEDLEEMSVKELKELADSYEIEYPKATRKSGMIKLLTESLFSDEEEEEELEEGTTEEAEAEAVEERPTTIVVEDEDGDEVEINLAEMTKAELLEFADEYGLEVTATKKAELLEEILDQVLDGEAEEEEATEEEPEEVEEEEDGEDLAEELGLNDMSVEELAELLEEHELSTKGKKQALVDRVLRAIQDGTIEVDEEGE
jgi:hypothetical protein